MCLVAMDKIIPRGIPTHYIRMKTETTGIMKMAICRPLWWICLVILDGYIAEYIMWRLNTSKLWGSIRYKGHSIYISQYGQIFRTSFNSIFKSILLLKILHFLYPFQQYLILSDFFFSPCSRPIIPSL